MKGGKSEPLNSHRPRPNWTRREREGGLDTFLGVPPRQCCTPRQGFPPRAVAPRRGQKRRAICNLLVNNFDGIGVTKTPAPMQSPDDSTGDRDPAVSATESL